jgi:glycosyltransferase involved in cell wall biosynthesis
MHDQFKISVIVPTFNRAMIVTRAIASILKQTYPVHEIVVVDDGSTDHTEEALQKFLGLVNDENVPVRYVTQKQQGVAAARNTGIAHATGDWIAFLDSDDIWLAEKLEWQVKALQNYAGISEACVTDACYANNPFLTQSAFTAVRNRFNGVMGIITEYPRRITSHQFHGAYLQALLVRTELIRRLGGFYAPFPVNEDTDFFFQLAQNTSVCYVNIPLVKIDRTPNRTTGLTDLRNNETYRLRMAQLMYEKWLMEYQGGDPEIPMRIRQRLRDIHIGWASCHLIAGDSVKALHSVTAALEYSFSLKGAVKWVSIKFTPELTKSQLLRRRASPPPPLL